MAGIQFTSYVPTSLIVNSPSPTLAAEVVTGLPISTGAFPGNAFYLTETQANSLSPNGGPVYHAGWYMVVQVAATANAAKVQPGFVGHQFALASTSASVSPQSIVTDAGNGIAIGINPVVFLNAITPGNYGIVQIAGDALVYASAAQAVGAVVAYSTAGTSAALANFSAATNAAVVGVVEAVTGAAGIARVNVSFPFGVV